MKKKKLPLLIKSYFSFWASLQVFKNKKVALITGIWKGNDTIFSWETNYCLQTSLNFGQQLVVVLSLLNIKELLVFL